MYRARRNSGPLPAFVFGLAFAVAVLCSAATPVRAQDEAVAPDVDALRSKITRIDWADADITEAKVLDMMATSSDWAFRALALMRLARYEGREVREKVVAALADESWQVRCYAIRHCWVHGYEIDPAIFDDESDARVIRTAMYHGVPVNDDLVTDMTARLLRMRTVDALLMGIELGAGSTNEGIRRNASRRTLTLVKNMDAQVAAVIGRRLAYVLNLDPAPANVMEWRQWVASIDNNWRLPAPRPPAHVLQTASLIVDADSETFIRLQDYLGVLRQRNLEMVIVMDATTSMAPMIDTVKADVDALILFLSDISSTLRLGICAFRDHDNPGRLIEAHPFSTDLESLRNFLFGLATPGGATYPEAVLAGVDACRQYDWTEQAERQIVLIGDAPPHEHEQSDLRRLLDWFRQQGFQLHAVHVPMAFPRGYLQQLPPARAQQEEQARHDYNIATQGIFQEIANVGNGKLVELDATSQNDLVRSLMKLTIEQQWWPYFDEFYDAYLELCR